MSTWLISLVVVGGSIAIVIASITGELRKPATDDGERHGARADAPPERLVPPVAEPARPRPPQRRPAAAEPVAPSTGRRLRSGLLLALLLAALGAISAVAIGLGAIVLVTALRQAVR